MTSRAAMAPTPPHISTGERWTHLSPLPPFPRPLLKHLLGVPVSFDDLQFVDSSLHQTLGWMVQNQGVDQLAIYFTGDGCEGGEGCGGRSRDRTLTHPRSLARSLNHPHT